MIDAIILLAAAAGSFYWGRHIASVQLKNNELADNYSAALKHIEEVETALEEMARENDYVRREMEIRAEKKPNQSAWNPGDPLNSQPR